MRGPITRELHALIRAMHPNQKRKFTMYCQLSKHNSNSLVLFNVLSKLKAYDRDKLKKELQKKGRALTAKNLSTEVSLLYKIVLRILLFITPESIENKLRRHFQEVVFLEGKGHFVKAKRIMKTLKEDAQMHNQDTLLIDIERYQQSKIEALKDRNENYSNVFVVGFAKQLDTNNFAVLDQLVPVLLAESDKYKDVETSSKLAFFYNLSAYYFRKQDFGKTLDWIEKVFDTASFGDNSDVVKKTRVLNLLTHFELKAGRTLLISLIKKARRGYKDVEGAKGLLVLIFKLINADYKKWKLEKEDFQTALQKLDKLEKTNTALPYYEIELWLKSKIG